MQNHPLFLRQSAFKWIGKRKRGPWSVVAASPIAEGIEPYKEFEEEEEEELAVVPNRRLFIVALPIFVPPWPPPRACV